MKADVSKEAVIVQRALMGWRSCWIMSVSTSDCFYTLYPWRICLDFVSILYGGTSFRDFFFFLCWYSPVRLCFWSVLCLSYRGFRGIRQVRGERFGQIKGNRGPQLDLNLGQLTGCLWLSFHLNTCLGIFVTVKGNNSSNRLRTGVMWFIRAERLHITLLSIQ